MPTISVDSVPQGTFTPQDNLVENLRVCLEKNCSPFLSDDADKPFLITWLIKERTKLAKDSFVAIIVENDAKAQLFSSYLHKLTLCNPVIISKKVEEVSENKSYNGKLIIATPEGLNSDDFKGKKLCLLIIDNGHHLMLNEDVRKFAISHQDSEGRIVILLANLLRDKENEKLLRPNALHSLLKDRLQEFPTEPESCSDLMSMLRFFCSPKQQIVEYCIQNQHWQQSNPESEFVNINEEIDKIVENCYAFLRSHHYSLLEIYGPEFQDLIDDVPDPTELPLKLLDDFVRIKNTLGLWCAERAALLLIIKIDRLKTREKYERHFLLLSILYTEMVKVRKICEEAFGELSDHERLIKYSTPRLIKLVEILRQYKPEHVARSLRNPKPKAVTPPPLPPVKEVTESEEGSKGASQQSQQSEQQQSKPPFLNRGPRGRYKGKS